MGFSSDAVVHQPVPKDLLCSVCLDVLERPVEGPCQHPACDSCLRPWLARKGTCPKCRGSFTTKKLKAAHPSIRSLVDSLVVRCEYAENGCAQTMPLENLRHHLQNDCPEATVRCPHIGCKETGTRRRMEEDHVDSCYHKLVACRLCNSHIKQGKQEAHLAHVCPKAEVACSNNGGCGALVRRAALVKHLEKHCAKTVVTCPVPGCSEIMERAALEGHVGASAAAHVTKLSEVVRLQGKTILTLTQRLGALEQQAAAPVGQGAWKGAWKGQAAAPVGQAGRKWQAAAPAEQGSKKRKRPEPAEDSSDDSSEWDSDDSSDESDDSFSDLFELS
eukprot:jgi/Mesvir1/11950/Mv00278-RA.1